MGREHEIVKHLSLCASLMSDPKILTNYPDIVADQFKAAMVSIETLGSFLMPRTTDSCGCSVKGWMDVSIIYKGIRNTVFTALDTHLKIIRTREFPKIVEIDFKAAGTDDPENYFIREIKETNCMGSIIILYYYLYWFIFLIRVNISIDPSHFTKADLAIAWLVGHLPQSAQFLEHRHYFESFKFESGEDIDGQRANYIGRLGKLAEVMAKNRSMIGLMGPQSLKERLRISYLIPAYRVLLDGIVGTSLGSPVIHELPNFPLRGVISVCNTLSMDGVLNGVAAMGAMSSIELQDPTQKWIDMHRDTEVTHTKDGKTGKYRSNLAKILSEKPYSFLESEWLGKGKKACLYDYCSMPLMMDICRSFFNLAALVETLDKGKITDDATLQCLHAFCVNLSGSTLSERMAKEYLRKIEKTSDFPGELTDEEESFINKSNISGSVSHETRHAFAEERPFLKVYVSNFKALYPYALSTSLNRNKTFLLVSPENTNGGQCSDLETLLQAFYLPYLSVDGESIKFLAFVSCCLIPPLLRNSSMMIHGSCSCIEFLKRISGPVINPSIKFGFSTSEKVSTFTDCISSNFNTLRPDASFTSERFGAFDEANKKIYSTDIVNVAKSTEFSFSDIMDVSKNNRNTYDALLQASGKFNTYPGIVFPVTYTAKTGSNPATNIGVFKRVSGAPVAAKVNSADIVSQLASAVQSSSASAERAASAAEKSSGPLDSDLRAIVKVLLTPKDDGSPFVTVPTPAASSEGGG